MARKEISTPLDLKNLDNHNYNYEELYSLIDETDRRISEDMWEEIKDANTMKMLEPVQTAADLPSEAADKSLITVIDEQRVYAYFQNEWQPFNQIDLDPFEPFKAELQTMIDNHEATAQQLLSDMQTEHDNAVTEITGLTSDFNTDYQAKMDAFASDYQTKSDQLLADYNSYSEQIDTNTTDSLSSIETNTTNSLSDIDTNTTSSLSDIDTAKSNALTELENFQNTDTTEWQKFKLTKDDGGAKDLSGVDWADPTQLDALDAGFYYSTTGSNIPVGASSYNAFITITERSSGAIKHIEFRPYNSNQVFIKRFYETWGEWEPAQGTKVELYKGSASGVDTTISLSAPYDKFDYLFVSFDSTPGKQTKIFEGQSSAGIVISVNNVYNDASNAKAYEMAIARTDLTTLTITNEASYTFTGSGSSDSTVVIEKIVGVK